MSAREENSLQIKPLTKRSRMTGELYTRRAEVERQLAQVVSFDNSRILELLKNKSRESEEYLFDETIVYLLREWSAEKKDFAFETLYLELNRRVWRLLKKFYKNFAAAADFEDFGQKIELAVIEKIFDLESDSADYAQINFGHFVVTQAKVFWSGNLVKIKRWHVNSPQPIDGWDAYKVEPATPMRVFAGHTTYFYMFDDEAAFTAAAIEAGLIQPEPEAEPEAAE